MKITFSQTHDETGVRWDVLFPCGRTVSATVRPVTLDLAELAGLDWINRQGETTPDDLAALFYQSFSAEENELTVASIYDPERLLPFVTGPAWTSSHYALHWSNAIAFARHCIDQAWLAAKASTPQDGIH